MQTSESQAISTVVASFLALLQVFRLLPDQAKGRYSLWAFSLVFLIPYAANQWKIQNAQSLARLGSSIVSPHPIEVLTNTAKAKFHALLQRQSKSYSAAHGEYRRRYGAEPPVGFEAWYVFAASQQSPIIDDFDIIFDLVSPFWELSGDEMLERMRAAQATPNSELWRCNYSGDDGTTHCSHPSRSDDRHLSLLFDTLLKGSPAKIASITFLVNHLDEPRVLIPSRRSEARGNSTEQQFNMTDLSHQPTWDTLTKFCPYSTPYGTQLTLYPLPFITNPTAAKDLCQHPEYQDMHGLFLSPASLPLIRGLVPILSTSSLSTTSDILFPSPAYIEPEFQYEATHDIAWDKKRNNLYWAGSTTGAHASNDEWPFFHRQRFVALAQNLLRKNYTYTYLRNYNGVLARVHSAFLNTRLFDVAFTRISQCARRYCAAQDAYFRVKSWANKNRALHSKLVFDLDGNGISGRYYQLLASNSAPLKQTLLREWHDERLVPWVHYIPVSMGMEELPELVTHLTANEAGMRTARDVAEAGKEWFGKALREVDRSVYVYRLLLELARIQDPEREAGFPLEGRRESAR
ncbi:hypothetical protein HBI81_176100 [Parastagonospora nodorum]|nr:hypothetical protein HBI81_176100 [Parastagonospora nodorum]